MPPRNHIDRAEQALRHFADHPLNRWDAARLLQLWSGRWSLDPADKTALLARFPDRTGAEGRHAAT